METRKIKHIHLNSYHLKCIYYHSGPKLSVSAVIFWVSRGLKVSVIKWQVKVSFINQHTHIKIWDVINIKRYNKNIMGGAYLVQRTGPGWKGGTGMRWFCQSLYGGSVCWGGLGNSKLCMNIMIAASFREIKADEYLARYKSSKRWHTTLMCQ